MKRQWYWIACQALLASLASGGLFAHQAFRSTTALLTLDVSVVDKDGHPIANLAPEDFEVSLNGGRQPVRTMVFLATNNTNVTQTVRQAPPILGEPLKSAVADSSKEPDPRLFVIMIDDLSISPLESKGLFVAAERFLATIPNRDWVGFTTSSGFVTVNPSLDRTLLLKRLKRAFGSMNDPRALRLGPFVGLMDSLEIDSGSEGQFRNVLARNCGIPDNVLAQKNLAQLLADYSCVHEVDRIARDQARFARANTRNQLDVFEAVIKAMAPAPGVKQLVILTGGIALRPADSVDFIPLSKAAAAAGVQLTMMMEAPDGVDNGRGFAGDQWQMLHQAQTLAEMSGGQFYTVIGQADRFYRRVLESASSVYRIGIDLPSVAPTSGQYDVRVRVNRPGVQVHASRYAAPPALPDAPSPEEQVKRSLRSGEPAYAVPIQMTASVVKSMDGQQTAIRVLIVVPGETLGPVSGSFGIVGPDHELKSGRKDLTKSADGKTYHLDFLVPVALGTYDLRFAVADVTGAVGAISQKIVVK